jgi:Ca2+-binding RTX toxin-like protein
MPTFNGTAGNDTLAAGYGDSVDGGGGVDTLSLSFAAAPNGVTFDTGAILAGRLATVFSGVIQNIQAVDSLRGSDFDDTLTIGVQSTPLTVDGGGGIDTVVLVPQAGFYDISHSGSVWTLTDTTTGVFGSVTLTNIEFARFLGGQIVDLRGSNPVQQGTSTVDYFTGTSGNDIIHGGDGNDTLGGDAGNDFLYGEGGDDLLWFSTSRADHSAGDDYIDGGDGVDTLGLAFMPTGVTISLATTAHQTIAPGLGLTLLSIENLSGTDYADHLTGDGGSNQIFGGRGDDVIDGGGGADTAGMYGRSYEYVLTPLNGGWVISDTISSRDGVDALTSIEFIKFADETFDLTGANLVIRGTSGSDNLHGTVGDDIMLGLGGGDTFYSSAGNDTFDGGGSPSAIYFSDAPSAIQVDLSITTAQVTGQGSDTLISIQSLFGSVYNDTLKGDDGANTINGGGGGDVIDGRGGADIITAGGGNYVIHGGDGNDILIGGGGDGQIFGDAGNDLFQLSSGNDFVDGGDGADALFLPFLTAGATVSLVVTTAQDVSPGLHLTLRNVENIVGTVYADVFTGDDRANVIQGDAGNDVIRGGDGADTLRGGSGDDQIFGEAGDDLIEVSSENTQLTAGDDLIDGGAGVDTVSLVALGGPNGLTFSLTTAHQSPALGVGVTLRSIENLIGTEFADTLTGDASDNVISGYRGNDVIDGGDGVDTAAFRGNASDFTITQTSAGWTVASNGSFGDGVDTLKNIEYVKFTDRTISLASLIPPPITTPPVITPPPAQTVTLTYASAPVAVSNILRGSTETGPMSVTAQAIANKLAAGIITSEAALQEVIKAADATTSVATMAYQFFTGKIPTAAGLDFLVSPSGPNPNNLNSAYYQTFNLENRYINFAMNLGKVGEGQAGFAGAYGSLSLAEATKKAYGVIFGADPTDAKVAALLADGRDAYFASYGNDGAGGIGTKAAMVGWLLAEAEKAHVGTYAQANVAFLTDLADGASYGVDLVGIYAKPEYALVA